MKFVIKSLLFVNLILQLTSCLRRCFDHDQNLMLTIILLAFSLIGLIGLVVGNRFILVIFSACMTLILIASITIYAIGKTEKDALQPKVPYYISSDPSSQAEAMRQSSSSSDSGRIKSLVNRLLLNRNSSSQRIPTSGDAAAATKRGRQQQRANRTRANQEAGLLQMRRSMAGGGSFRNRPAAASAEAANLSSISILDDYSDDPAAASLGPPLVVPAAGRSAAAKTMLASDDELGGAAVTTRSADGIKSLGGGGKRADDDSGADYGNQVPSEQWVAYERYLYEKYLNIVSQSIDLIMQTILGSWLALLLDEEADQCFGGKPGSLGGGGGQPRRKSSSLGGAATAAKESLPVYNYNGVRYSIRPEPSDSAALR